MRFVRIALTKSTVLQLLHLHFEMRIKLFSPPENGIHDVTAVKPAPRSQIQHVGPICFLESSRTVPELCKVHARLRTHVVIVDGETLHQTDSEEERCFRFLFLFRNDNDGRFQDPEKSVRGVEKSADNIAW
jgi:hypothetical protein